MMNRVLITGANSYIGTRFANYAKDRFHIETIGTHNNEWKTHSFGNYDSILHVAGIAHVKETKANASLYHDINCALAVAIAQKTKEESVKHFLFLRSLYIYIYELKARQTIGQNTLPNPGTAYGTSKYQAELELQKLADSDFNICCIRPPMVYGPSCKGNFPSLVKLAKMLPIFPDFPNKRSMIFIDNLCEHLCRLIESESQGATLPHNSEYVTTTELVKEIRKAHGKKTLTVRFFNPLIRLLSRRINLFNKIFGCLYYEMQGNEEVYNVSNFEESIRKSIG